MTSKEVTRVWDGFYQVDIVQTPNGKREIIHALNAVAVLLYIPARDEIVLISQIRLPMKNEENPEGRIIEVPAGRFDKDLDAKDLIIQEVLEEAGITLKRRQIRLLNNGVPLATSPGSLTQRDYLAYAEVEEKQIERGDRIFGAEDEDECLCGWGGNDPLRQTPGYHIEGPGRSGDH